MGFLYHSAEEPYWNESACYEFHPREIDQLETATNVLQELCAEAVQTILDRDWFDRLKIPSREEKLIRSSWENDELSLYGRFDLAWDGQSPPKMLEYNADTPTSVFEAAIIQWEWVSDRHPRRKQFNSLHERLKARWPEVAGLSKRLHFLCMRDSVEDLTQTEYLRDVAHQAGFETEFLFIEDLGWNGRRFIDLEDRDVRQAFKLYPWEWLAREEFGQHLHESGLQLIEPAWKRVLSTKAILPILWELFPEHPNLLPAYFEPPSSGDFVRKPMLSREGSRITVFKNGTDVLATDGPEECSNFIYQQYHELPKFDDRYVVIGSWIIGEESAGIGLREDVSLITRNLSQFVPHFIGEERSHSWI